MKKLFLLIFGVLIFLLSGCCGITIPTNQSVPQATSAMPTCITSTEVPEFFPTEVATEEVNYETINIGDEFTGDQVFLTYDPDQWYSTGDSTYPELTASQVDNCLIYYLYGLGMDPSKVDLIQNNKRIGNTTFEYSAWIEIATDSIVWASFSWDMPGIYPLLQVVPSSGTMSPIPDACIQAVEEILALSEAKDFKP